MGFWRYDWPFWVGVSLWFPFLKAFKEYEVQRLRMAINFNGKILIFWSTHVNQKKFHSGKFLSGIFTGSSWGVIIVGKTPARPVWRSHIFPNPWGISNERRHQRGDVRAIRHLRITVLPRDIWVEKSKAKSEASEHSVFFGGYLPWEISMAYWEIVEIYGNPLGMWLNFHVHGILRCWWGDLPFQLPPWEFAHFIKPGMVWWRMNAAFPTWKNSIFKSLVPKKPRHPSFLVTSPCNSKPYLDVHTNDEWAIYLAGDTPYIAGKKQNVCHPLVCPV